MFAPISTSSNARNSRRRQGPSRRLAPTLSTADAGKVRLGGLAPTLGTADAGKVRLGGCAPTLGTADAGKVRLGGLRPVAQHRRRRQGPSRRLAPTLSTADAGKVRLGGWPRR